MAEESKSSLDALSALCKRRGFIYHSSEIYGGMPGFWDYGPLGCELKANVKQAALCKRRGFIYHSSEIYGGMPGFWDYGPLGCELKTNVKQAWWQFTVRGREDVAGLDATIIMHPKMIR